MNNTLSLTAAFLKIFFRNYRALFFVLVLPVVIYIAISYLGLDNIISFNGEKQYQGYLLPGIIAMSLVQMGVFSAGYTLIDFRRSGVLKQLAVTPLSPFRFLLAHAFARWIMALVQTGILLLCGLILFDIMISWRVVFAPILSMAGLALFINFGYLIASLAKDYEDAAPATAIINLLLLFLGDVFFPSRLLSPAFNVLADILPMKALSAMFRYVLTGGEAVTLIQVLVFVAWFIVTSVLAQRIFARKAYK